MTLRALFLLSVLVSTQVPAAAQQQLPAVPREPDGWSRRITWRTQSGGYATAAHATLLPDGRVVFIGHERPVKSTTWSGGTEKLVWVQSLTPAGEPLPPEVVVAEAAVPLEAEAAIVGTWFVDDNLFCTGNTLTADGAFFSAGGTRGLIDLLSGDLFVTGLAYATTFDGTNWTRIPAYMEGTATLGDPLRWYPAATRLSDERILVVSGDDLVIPALLPNLSVEAYDPALGDWEVLSAFGATPAEIWNQDYTHPFVLPDPVIVFDVLMFGQLGQPVLFSTALGLWYTGTPPRPGTLAGESPNFGASSALLPIRSPNGEWGYSNGSALVAGGTHASTHQRSADVYDPVAGAWLPRVDLGTRRHHPATVALPDGRMLLVAGHAKNGAVGTQRATFVDPAAGFAVTDGHARAGQVRGYHTIALLLPDGRVLVGGGQDLVTGAELEKAHFQYYYPPYLFRPRPVIAAAAATMAFGTTYAVTTDEAPPDEVVLVALGSMTHSIDTNQRHVELPIVAVAGNTASLATPDPQTAPPGYYMLFALDAERTPSEARIVHLR